MFYRGVLLPVLLVAMSMPALAADKEKSWSKYTPAERKFAGRTIEMTKDILPLLDELSKEAAKVKVAGAKSRGAKTFWLRSARPSSKIHFINLAGTAAIKACRPKDPEMVELQKQFKQLLSISRNTIDQTREGSRNHGISLPGAINTIKTGRASFKKAGKKMEALARDLQGIAYKERRRFENDTFPPVPVRKEVNERRAEWTEEERDYGERVDTFCKKLDPVTSAIYRYYRQYDAGKITEAELLHRSCTPAAKLIDPAIGTFTDIPPSAMLRQTHESLLNYVRKARELGDLLPNDRTMLKVEGFKFKEDKVDEACDAMETARRAARADLRMVE